MREVESGIAMSRRRRPEPSWERRKKARVVLVGLGRTVQMVEATLHPIGEARICNV